MATREQLQEQFTKLRNATYPKNRYGRDRYYDFLNDTDTLAKNKTDEELEKAIKQFQSQG